MSARRDWIGAALTVAAMGALPWWLAAFATHGPLASAPRFVVYATLAVSAGRVFHGRWW